MCIYRITRRLTSKKRFSCLVRSPRLSILAMQALILSVIFHAPLRAQAPYPGTFILGGHRDEFDVMEERIRKSGLGYDQQSPEAPPENAKVSVDELRYPLTEKARRILIKALNYIQKGDHPKAIATIKEGAAKVHAVVPYTHGLLASNTCAPAEWRKRLRSSPKARPCFRTTPETVPILRCLCSSPASLIAPSRRSKSRCISIPRCRTRRKSRSGSAKTAPASPAATNARPIEPALAPLTPTPPRSI